MIIYLQSLQIMKRIQRISVDGGYRVIAQVTAKKRISYWLYDHYLTVTNISEMLYQLTERKLTETVCRA